MPGGAARLGEAFQGRRGSTGLVPFLTAGYPSLETSLEMMLELDRQGAIALEIGIPFSDPIADGPEIQRASEAALAHGVGPAETLELVRRFRDRATLPVIVMTYANPILRHGIGQFAERARAAGVDGAIVSDLPPDESPEVWAALDAAELATILLVAPTSSPARVPMLLERCRGFVYCLARTGVTGRALGYAGSIADRVQELRSMTKLPIAVGFGIANAEAARALRGVPDAVVVGAAFMRAVSEDPLRGAVQRVSALAREIQGALD
jgi:tryptophan synthase alpha chain